MARKTIESRWDFGGRDHGALLRESRSLRGESLWQDAWRRLRRNRAAAWSLAFLVLFGLTAFLAPILPLPSPVAMDLSAAEALAPRWPWAHTRLAAEWDPVEDADVAPGVLPTRALGNLANDGWRHQALLQFHAPESGGDGALRPGGGLDGLAALAALVRRVSGRVPRVETRPGPRAGVLEHTLCVPLHRDDAQRVDYLPTGVEGELLVWHSGEQDAERVTYDLSVPYDPGAVQRWSVDQRTRRGQLYVTPLGRADSVSGYQYTFTLQHVPRGEPAVLVLNGERYGPEGERLAPAPPGPKRDLQTTAAREHIGEVHPDLGRRVEAALGETLEEALQETPQETPGEDLEKTGETRRAVRRGGWAAGVELVTLSAQDGYWELNALDRWMLGLRARVFGSWQTGNWMGTDENGRDIAARIVWGSRTSILVALAATACSLIIGVVYGALSGLLGGRVDNVMMRVVDILYSVPFIFVVIFVITIVNEYRTELEDTYGIDRELIFFVVIGAIYWLTMARVVRGQVLSLKNSEFIEATRVLGASTARILFAHLVPNVLSIVIVYLTLTIPAVMLFEAFLSFLGLGIEPPKVSWGLLAVDGTKALNPLQYYWWLVVFPALAMGSTLLTLNVLGDGLRDALDPKLRGKD